MVLSWREEGYTSMRHRVTLCHPNALEKFQDDTSVALTRDDGLWRISRNTSSIIEDNNHLWLPVKLA